MSSEGMGSSINTFRDSTISSSAVVDSSVLLPARIFIEDEVHIEKGVIFCDVVDKSTTVRRGARICAGAVIGPGVEVGAGSQVMHGAVVFQSVPANAVVKGNPAQIVGYTNTSSRLFSGRQSGALMFSAEKESASAIVDLGIGDSKLYKLPYITDLRGSLSVGEFDSRLPFAPKRYFLVFDVPSEELRGEHAHRKCHQFLVCVHGTCTALIDDGSSRKEITLDKPNIGLYMPPMIWGTQYSYSRDAVLLVFASNHYDNSDYIRTYDDFCAELAGAAK